MFRSKNDRRVLELMIEFNLTAISKWIKSTEASKDKNASQIKAIGLETKYDQTALRQQYFIDVLPNGEKSDMYHHRIKGVISGNIGGTDFLQNAGAEVREFAKQSKIGHLGWNLWREYIRLTVNSVPILLAPIKEWAELQSLGRTKIDNSNFDGGKMQVPILFSDNNQPIDFTDIWRYSPARETVAYSNALGRASASCLHYEVEY